MSLKPIIKSAREALDRKDYPYALQLCTDALEFEPDNYWLLVFKAVALGAGGHTEKALIEYGKAAKVQADNPTSFQGIINLYEQKNLELDERYFSALEQLSGILFKQNEFDKHYSLIRKRLNLFKEAKNISECVKILRWLSGAEAQEFYPPELRPNPHTLLQEQYDLLAPQEAAQISKDMETGRLRLSTATESLERLSERVQVQNYSKDLTDILRELVKLKPEKYLETYSKRILRIVLSDFCPNEEIRKDYANELLQLNIPCVTYNTAVTEGDEPVSPFVGPRNVLNRLKEAVEQEEFENVLKLIEQLEMVCKKWNRAFSLDTSNYLSQASKFKLKALISLNYNGDALELAQKFTDEELSDDFFFESILNVFEGGRLLSRAINLIEFKLMHVDPGHPGLILRLIDDLIELQRFNEASEYLQAVKEAYEADTLDPRTRAHIAYSNGLCSWYIGDRQSKTTLAHFLTAAKEDPSEAKHFTWIGKFYWRIEGDGQRALKCFTKALSLDGQCLQAALLYSEITLLSSDENIQMVCDLLKPFTGISLQARNRRLFYYYGIALFRCLNYLDASVAFQTALKGSLTLSHMEDVSSDPSISDENCLQWLGESYLRSNRLGSAAKAFTRLNNLNEGDLVAKTGLAAVHLKSSNPIEAVDILDSIHSTPFIKIALDKSQAALDLARFYLRQGRFISATKSIANSLSYCLVSGSSAESLRMAADAFILADSYKEIYGFPHQEFEKYISLTENLQINPGLSEIYNNLSSQRQDNFKIVSVKYALAAVSEAFKDPSRHCLSAYWLQLAVSLSKIDTLDDFSISAAENSIKSSDSDGKLKAQAHHLQALIYARSNSTRRESQHHFISALKCQESSQIWTDLGRFYFDSGDWELGSEAFKRALSVDQDDLVAAFELARCLGTREASEAAKQVALRAFTTQPVHFTEDFAWILSESDGSITSIYAKVYLKRRFPTHPKLKDFKYNDTEPVPCFNNKLEVLNYLNSKDSDPTIWISPLADGLDCEFLLKRPENEVTQSGWRAVVEGLLPTTKERTLKEAEELAQ